MVRDIGDDVVKCRNGSLGGRRFGGRGGRGGAWRYRRTRGVVVRRGVEGGKLGVGRECRAWYSICWFGGGEDGFQGG